MGKFGFGSANIVVKVGAFLAGVQTEKFGGRFVSAGLLKSNADGTPYEYEYGEIVKLNKDFPSGYEVIPVDSTTLATDKLAVIMRTVDGGTQRNQLRVDGAIENVTVSLWLLDPNNKGKIAVFLADTANPAIGGAVYLGLGTGTVKGAVYASAVGDAIQLTGVEFKDVAKKPTQSDARTVVIGYK